MTHLALVTPEPDANRAHAPDLRRELRDAQVNFEAADASARQARAIADKAGRLLREAQDNVQRLKTNLEAVRRAAVEHRSRTIAAALRDGIEPGATPAPASADTAALSAAEAYRDAVDRAEHVVTQEAADADAAVSRAAASVNALVDEIMLSEVHELGRAMTAAIEEHWRLLDRLAGFLSRPGGPRLEGFQAELMTKIDRRKRAIAANPLMAESKNWLDHMDALAADQARLWQAYVARLTVDATATFEESA